MPAPASVSTSASATAAKPLEPEQSKQSSVTASKPSVSNKPVKKQSKHQDEVKKQSQHQDEVNLSLHAAPLSPLHLCSSTHHVFHAMHSPRTLSEPQVIVRNVLLSGDRDLTTIPNELNAKYLTLDLDGTLRPTAIKVDVSRGWTKSFQRNLLSDPETKTLNESNLKEERDTAFDLLDALSRSGTLDIVCAELHVVVAATHRFARTVVDTVIMDNVNPIEKVERSVLIVGTTIHNEPDVGVLLEPDHTQRVWGHSPQLFLADTEDKGERQQQDK